MRQFKSIARLELLLLALTVPPACAETESEARPAPSIPVAMAPELAGLLVRIHPEGSEIGREVGLALGTELARAGLSVLADERRPSDADLRLALDLRSLGIVVEGVTSLSVESGGVLLDRFTTSLDVFRRDTFSAAVARELAEAFARSPRIRAFAAARKSLAPATVVASADTGGPQDAQTPAIPPAPTAVPPPPPAVSSPPPATPPAAPPSTPEVLGKSGRFGLGLSLEANLGWNQVFASAASPAGAVVALALQFDLGPRAAFRLPMSFAFAGAGNDEFGQLALAPAIIYRWRSSADQELVPYLGLGLRLGAALGGRHLLGRPVTGVAGADSCSDSREHPRSTGAPIPDCAFFVSPEPTLGLEWHASRLFAIDIALAYSFAHFSSSEGLPRWVSLFQLYLGPRVSF